MNKRIISLLLSLVMVFSLVACGGGAESEGEASGDVAMQYITIDDAKTKLEDDGYVFFDIRKAADSSTMTVPGAQAWDMDAAKEGDAEAGKATMTEATKDLDKNIVLVCYSGKRYAQAATNALAAIGYDMSKVWTLEGGFTAWSEQCPELVEVLKEIRTDIVMYSSADIGTLDPMVAKTGADTIVVGLAYDNLVEYIYEYAEDGSSQAFSGYGSCHDRLSVSGRRLRYSAERKRIRHRLGIFYGAFYVCRLRAISGGQPAGWTCFPSEHRHRYPAGR